MTAEKNGPRQEAANPAQRFYPESTVFEARLRGFGEGWDAAKAIYQPMLDQLNYTADRLYAEMCRRTPPKYDDRPQFADLERTRDEIYAGVKR
jgi:hypothetical protein